MRDHQLNLKWHVQHEGGWGKAELAVLTKRLNDTPMGFRDRKDLEFPHAVIRQWLAATGVRDLSAPIRRTRFVLPN